MATHKEIRRFFYKEEMIEKTNFLLKRYEPTNLDELDILRIIYPVVKDYYSEIISNKKINYNILKRSDDAIRRYLFPKSYIQKESCDKIYDKWKKGDIKAFDKLIERNLHLPSLILSRLGYFSPFDEDLFEIGIEALILNIKKYDKSYSKCISSYLNDKVFKALASEIKEYNKNMQEKEIDLLSLKPNTPILHYSDSDDGWYDNVNDYVEIKNVSLFRKNVLKTPYLTFLEKISIMARFGFINNLEISYKELAECLNAKHQNFEEAVNKGFLKLQKLQNINNINYDYSLFEFFLSDKRIVLYCMKDLQAEEMRLIKNVWGEDFINLKDFEDINFTKEQVLIYYKAISKIHKSIKTFMNNTKNNKIGYEIFSDEEKEVQPKKE